MRLILIHGTGAGIPLPDGGRWWQADSFFAKQIRETLGENCFIDDSFRWGDGGKNSERARLKGASDLLVRLVQLESNPEEKEYHLIGHSHGGSVIWHALSLAEQSRVNLSKLKSITTVGTPFLWFAPSLFDVRMGFVFLLYTVVLIGGLALITKNLILEMGAIFRQSTGWWLGATLAILLLLMLVLFWNTAGFAGKVKILLNYYRNFKASVEAANKYGARWLCLWHIYDEAMLGLSATLATAPRMLSRRQRSSRLNGVLYKFLSIYDLILARTGDEMAWSVVMSRIQGSDIPGLVLTRVACVPLGVSDLRCPLPRKTLRFIRRQADNAAAVVLSTTRRRLRLASKVPASEKTLEMLANSFDWQAVIHTSYFDSSDVVKMIAKHVMETSCSSSVASVNLLCKKSYASQGNKHCAPRSIKVAFQDKIEKNLIRPLCARYSFSALIIAFLGILYFLIFQTTMYPFTLDAQISHIVARVSEPEIVTLEQRGSDDDLEIVPSDPRDTSQSRQESGPTNASYQFRSTSNYTPGGVLARLIVMGSIQPSSELLKPIQDAEQRSGAAVQIAYALGLEKRGAELQTFLRELQEVQSPDPIRRYPAGSMYAIASFAGIAGRLRIGDMPSSEEIDLAISSLKELVSTPLPWFASLPSIVVPILLAVGREKDVPSEVWEAFDVDNDASGHCSHGASATYLALVMRRVDIVDRLIERCQNNNAKQEILARAVRHALEINLLREAESLAATLKPMKALPLEIEFDLVTKNGRNNDASAFMARYADEWRRNSPIWLCQESYLTWLVENGYQDLVSSCLSGEVESARARYKENNIHEPIESVHRYAEALKKAGQDKLLLSLIDELRGDSDINKNAVYWMRIAVAKSVYFGNWSSAINEVERAADYFEKESAEARRYGDALSALPMNAIPVIAKPVRRMLNTARRHALSEVSLGGRGDLLLNVASYFILTNDIYQARTLVELSGRSEKIMMGYGMLLDHAIALKNPKQIKLHSFHNVNDYYDFNVPISPVLQNRGS